MSRFATLYALFLLLPVPEAAAQRAPCEGGLALGFPCDRVDLLGRVTLGEMGVTSASDVWGWTDPDTGREYALIGLYEGTGFVDVSDPVNPTFLGILPTHTPPCSPTTGATSRSTPTTPSS